MQGHRQFKLFALSYLQQREKQTKAQLSPSDSCAAKPNYKTACLWI